MLLSGTAAGAIGAGVLMALLLLALLPAIALLAIPLVLGAGSGQVLSVSVRPTLLASQATRSLSVDVTDALDVWVPAALVADMRMRD